MDIYGYIDEHACYHHYYVVPIAIHSYIATGEDIQRRIRWAGSQSPFKTFYLCYYYYKHHENCVQ